MTDLKSVIYSEYKAQIAESCDLRESKLQQLFRLCVCLVFLLYAVWVGLSSIWTLETTLEQSIFERFAFAMSVYIRDDFASDVDTTLYTF